MQNKNQKAGLMITLGHNSSALFYDGQSKPIGYEEERLTGKKSDSSFPNMSIAKIIENVSEDRLKGAKLFVSHWFDIFDEDKFPEKYYDQETIDSLVNYYSMEKVYLHQNFTHHDAHMYSSKAFMLDAMYSKDEVIDLKEHHYIVADGFGNNREVLSIYKHENGLTSLVERIYNYEMSLGLLYQYAASFCGMKENQDEYKFLGYESHILDVLNASEMEKLNAKIEEFCTIYFTKVPNNSHAPEQGRSYLDIQRLKACKQNFHSIFRTVLHGIENPEGLHMPFSENNVRIIIGYFIQNCVEKILSGIVDRYQIKNVCLSGGCFYNVKLNNSILKKVEGHVSVIPLAGDQGAAIGMYKKYIGDFKFYDLCYGVRSLNLTKSESEKILVFDDTEDFVSKVVSLIDSGNIVNIVSNEMEFGPRALCNTSTLALPTQLNVDYINKLNGRNTVMPMAPVILTRNVKALFDKTEQVERVIGSNNYMIMTHDFVEEATKSEKYKGVMHRYPDKSAYSGRPQIVDSESNKPIKKILEQTNSLCLINTSFNTHGTPILYSVQDCLSDFLKQSELDELGINYLVVLQNVD